MNLSDISKFLKDNDNFEIITHNYPDGDTLGSAYALCLALQQIGKNARVIVDKLPRNFEFLKDGVCEQNFVANCVVSTDIAADTLISPAMKKYVGNIDLCIDHHASNNITAKHKFVDGKAAANCEIIYKLLKEMQVTITKNIANCLYTGISTDTGCFRYTNTTSETLRISADLLELGCNAEYINKVMFETKTKEKLLLERAVYDTITYCANDKCAIINTTKQMFKDIGLSEDEAEGLASIPRQIEGVLIGITMREKTGGSFKISVRTNENINASDFCSKFGGGGHKAAAGCTIEGDLETVKTTLINHAEEFLNMNKAI